MDSKGRKFESDYQALAPYDGEEEEDETDDNELPVNEQEVLIHVCPESSKGELKMEVCTFMCTSVIKQASLRFDG